MANNNLPTRADFRRSNKKKKKHFYKSWWFWSIIIILLLAGGGFEGMKMTSTGPFSKTTKVTKKKKTTKKTTKKKTGITLNQYNGIYLSQTDGLSKSTLEGIFGKASSTTTSTVQNVSTDVYTWNKVADGTLGSKLTVNFANDHAISKNISGLKVSRSQKLGLEAYNSIQNGQTEDTILHNLGKPNGYSETITSDTNSKTLTYSSDISGDTGANFIVSLTGDQVSGKSQTGMQ